MTSLISQTTTPSAPAALNEKLCNTCGTNKPLTEYYSTKGTKDGLRGECKCCNKAATKARRQGPKRKQILDKQIDSQMKRLYGIGLDDYNKMLEDQGGKCAICNTSEPGHGGNRFCIDHCHTTGKVRGLLCMPCNVSIGHLKDNVQLLEKALNYVKVHKDCVP